MPLLPLVFLAAPAAAPPAPPGPTIPHLLLPKWPPTYNLTQSTLAQSCELPGADESYLPSWGIVSYDNSNDGMTWWNDDPNDSGQKLVDQAARAKRRSPSTRIWIYRNLVQAYAEFGQVREKLEDPAYRNWFVPFLPSAGKDVRCQKDKKGRTKCSDLYHRAGKKEEGDHSGNGDCGDVIPCGWYLFDHRNQSLRKWILDEFIMGPLGMGNDSVDGFLFDDRWDVGGPSEAGQWKGVADLPADAIRDIRSNWETTVWEAQVRIRDAGGFVWNNLNCELDGDNEWPPGDAERAPSVGGPSVRGGSGPCGLPKTEGYPSNGLPDMPGVVPRPKTAPQFQTRCHDYFRGACVEGSVLGRVPLLWSYLRHPDPHPNSAHAQFPLPAAKQDIASFLLVRGPYAWLGYGWLGCFEAGSNSSTTPLAQPEWLKLDFGEPVDTHCREESSGVFMRKWGKGVVRLDCNSFTASFDMSPAQPLPGG